MVWYSGLFSANRARHLGYLLRSLLNPGETRRRDMMQLTRVRHARANYMFFEKNANEQRIFAFLRSQLAMPLTDLHAPRDRHRLISFHPPLHNNNRKN